MASTEQKTSNKEWVVALTPIILALIGIVIPTLTLVFDKCKSNSSSNTEEKYANAAKTPTKKAQPVSPFSSEVATQKPVPATNIIKEKGIIFKGRVINANGQSGVGNAKIMLDDVSLGDSDEDGYFAVEIPKSKVNFVLSAYKKHFNCGRGEFSFKDNGTAMIAVKPH